MSIITLEEYKVYASINSPNLDDQITPLLEPATRVIEGYLGYTFLSDNVSVIPKKTYRFRTNKLQQDYVLPDLNTNISFIRLIPLTPSIDEANAIDLTDNDWFCEVDIGVISIFKPLMTLFIAEAEYITSHTAAEDIKLAGLMLVDYWRNKDHQQSITNQGQSVVKAPIRNLPKHVESILAQHRKV